ncbi:hypothetical protein AB1K84_22335 [Mesobacillus foraminis]|uniref:hypothetical protein n=1 Tax=Mesobacillus foraminis TaxID=279826 RepID=UPI00399FB20B
MTKGVDENGIFHGLVDAGLLDKKLLYTLIETDLTDCSLPDNVVLYKTWTITSRVPFKKIQQLPV